MRPRMRSVRNFQIASPDGGQPGRIVVDADDLVDRIDHVERQRQLGRIRHARLAGRRIAIDPRQDVVDVELVAQRRQTAVDRAGADGDQDLGVGAQFAHDVNVVGVAHPAFDQRDVAGTAMLDVGQRRAVELGELGEFEQAFVDVEERHVAAETAGERRRRQPNFDFILS